jgi:hypothetical protein
MAHTVDPDREAAYPKNSACWSLRPTGMSTQPRYTSAVMSIAPDFSLEIWPSMGHDRGFSTSAWPVAWGILKGYSTARDSRKHQRSRGS